MVIQSFDFNCGKDEKVVLQGFDFNAKEEKVVLQSFDFNGGLILMVEKRKEWWFKVLILIGEEGTSSAGEKGELEREFFWESFNL